MNREGVVFVSLVRLFGSVMYKCVVVVAPLYFFLFLISMLETARQMCDVLICEAIFFVA